jgi:CheY-like chemotaxis protein
MAILGHAELARDEISPMSPVRNSLDEIEKASRRAAELCRQILAYSGRGKFVIETLAPSDLVEEMVHLLRTSISKKTILNMNFDRTQLCMQGDPTQIRQVIMNLIINASEAIGEDSGVITISTGALECTRGYLSEALLGEDLGEGLYIYLEVSDTGRGMDEETLGRIFEPFFTTKFTGRGLGLSAVLGIVRGHKGALRVSSEVGKGTTFRILFPAVEEAAAPPAEKDLAAGDTWKGTGRVLLVDDEETIRVLGKRMLERLGFAVLTASDGREALRIYQDREEEIDLVLLDLTMPHMNGEEAFRELRRINPAIRVILSSGYTEHEIVARFAGKGLAGFIQKPYTVAALRDRLRLALPGDTGKV